MQQQKWQGLQESLRALATMSPVILFLQQKNGRGCRTRTYDTWFWRPVLYQLS